MEKNFTVSKVSNQAQGNFQAWARPVSNHTTIEEAMAERDEVWMEMVAELEARPDFGDGAIMPDTVMIFDKKFDVVG